MRISFKPGTSPAMLQRLKEGLTPQAVDGLVEQVALQTLAEVVQATPKKWFGAVRASWQIQNPGPGQRVVINPNKIMNFLEYGTQGHGPVTKKALFIPLSKKAVSSTSGEFVAFSSQSNGQTVRGLKVKTENSRGGQGTRSLIYGVDYVLAKYVKGISPMYIAKIQRALTKKYLFDKVKGHIANLIRG